MGESFCIVIRDKIRLVNPRMNAGIIEEFFAERAELIHLLEGILFPNQTPYCNTLDLYTEYNFPRRGIRENNAHDPSFELLTNCARLLFPRITNDC